MIVNLGDGVIAAMPDDAVDCGYDANNVFTSAASPRQFHGNSLAVTSVRRQADCGYNMNNVFKQPAAPPRAYQTSPPLAYHSAVVVLSLRRQAEKFYALQMSLGRSCGPHIFFRLK
jgi:hypothetical protein